MEEEEDSPVSDDSEDMETEIVAEKDQKDESSKPEESPSEVAVGVDEESPEKDEFNGTEMNGYAKSSMAAAESDMLPGLLDPELVSLIKCEIVEPLKSTAGDAKTAEIAIAGFSDIKSEMLVADITTGFTGIKTEIGPAEIDDLLTKELMQDGSTDFLEHDAEAESGWSQGIEAVFEEINNADSSLKNESMPMLTDNVETCLNALVEPVEYKSVVKSEESVETETPPTLMTDDDLLDLPVSLPMKDQVPAKANEGPEELEEQPSTKSSPNVSISIDGNVELTAKAAPAPSGIKIKINLFNKVSAGVKPTATAPSDVGETKVSNLKNEVDNLDNVSDVTPPYPDEIALTNKPRLIGRKLTDVPLKNKGVETSGLCSIM